MPYLHWERTGAPPAGPYNALLTRDLDDVEQLKKPDFMSNPHKFFGEKIDGVASSSSKLPAQAEGNAFADLLAYCIIKYHKNLL